MSLIQLHSPRLGMWRHARHGSPICWLPRCACASLQPSSALRSWTSCHLRLLAFWLSASFHATPVGLLQISEKKSPGESANFEFVSGRNLYFGSSPLVSFYIAVCMTRNSETLSDAFWKFVERVIRASQANPKKQSAGQARHLLPSFITYSLAIPVIFPGQKE